MEENNTDCQTSTKNTKYTYPLDDAYTYYQMVHAALSTIGNSINHTVDPARYQGRKKSGTFEEEEIKKHIRNNSDLIHKNIESILPTGVVLQRIDASEDTTEASGRTMADIMIIFQESTDNISREVIIPVNIKFTKGSSSDNVGGWTALEHTIFGDIHHSSKSGFYSRIQSYKHQPSVQPSDYFLWVFSKSDHPENVIPHATTYSLLTAYVNDALCYNYSQSFPLQSSLRKMKKAHTTVLTNDEMLAAKIGLVATMVKKEEEKSHRENLRCTNILDVISSTWKQSLHLAVV